MDIMKKQEILKKTAMCNVSYHIPGQTDRSAMPLGDGELCASVWTDGTGSVCMYLARSDARTEYDRTVKLGMIQIHFTPNPFTEPFYVQTLFLTEGRIEITGRGGKADVWIDRDSHTLRFAADFPETVKIRPEFVTWRTEDIVPEGEFSSEGCVVETADIVEPYREGTLFYHKNGKTIIEETAKLQALGDCLAVIPDLLTGRVFGGYLSYERKNREFHCSVVTHSAQTTAEAFREYVLSKKEKLLPWKESMDRCRRHWEEYWTKSYVFVEQDPVRKQETDPVLAWLAAEPMEYTCLCMSAVTRAYTLTKYMTACCSEGEFPILYNGMLFNLCPGEGQHFGIENFGRNFTAQPEAFTPSVNPDERSWTTEHLWQNIRHPYHSMAARGEADSMRVLFRYYRRFWEINRKRAERYYQASGQHNTEMTMSFGLQSKGIYGEERSGLADGYAQNRWGGAVDISPGLELICMMLDYFDYTKDVRFLKDEVLPYAKDLFEYIRTRFRKRKDGKIVIGPVNCIETYWNTVNPLPIVAGMQACADRMIQIDDLDRQTRKWFEDYRTEIPDLPVDGLLLPAEQYADDRKNVEIPELYAIFPFRVVGMNEETKKLAEETFKKRIKEFGVDKVFRIKSTPGTASYSGWQYIGQVAAMLGMKELAAHILADNCSLQNPGTRFPAMWGPIYDAVPDTDHGANILNQLQTMILQKNGDEVLFLHGFPENWNVEFRLHIDKHTVAEGVFRNGKWMKKDILENWE